jgi:hypothetical protein
MLTCEARGRPAPTLTNGGGLFRAQAPRWPSARGQSPRAGVPGPCRSKPDKSPSDTQIGPWLGRPPVSAALRAPLPGLVRAPTNHGPPLTVRPDQWRRRVRPWIAASCVSAWRPIGGDATNACHRLQRFDDSFRQLRTCRGIAPRRQRAKCRHSLLETPAQNQFNVHTQTGTLLA